MYDAEGTPIGMQYRNSSYASGAFDTFWFEKNLQGDIIAVYNENGTKLVSYTYDAWGNVTTTYHNSGASTAVQYNPFRYIGAEIGAIGVVIEKDEGSLSISAAYVFGGTLKFLWD